jgi:hypothetical protein
MHDVHHEVSLMLAQVNLKISDEKARLEQGTDREKVDAAGELHLLANQRARLEKRLAEISACGDSPETLSQWFAEEVFSLSMQLESWITHG